MSDLVLYFGNNFIVPPFSKKIEEKQYHFGSVLFGEYTRFFIVYVATPTTFAQNHFESVQAYKCTCGFVFMIG